MRGRRRRKKTLCTGGAAPPTGAPQRLTQRTPLALSLVTRCVPARWAASVEGGVGFCCVVAIAGIGCENPRGRAPSFPVGSSEVSRASWVELGPWQASTDICWGHVALALRCVCVCGGRGGVSLAGDWAHCGFLCDLRVLYHFLFGVRELANPKVSCLQFWVFTRAPSPAVRVPRPGLSAPSPLPRAHLGPSVWFLASVG